MDAVMIGKTFLKQFRVEQFISSGGMASVYRVWDLQRNVSLAMKVLHSELAEDPSIFKRFEREANALKQLAHPNIVPFYGLYQTEDFAFLLELYINGPTLKDILKRFQSKPLPIQQALIFVKVLSAALGYAHSHGVIHCDVKPGNVMIDQGGNIFLTDFGIARHSESQTTTIGVSGTPAYMAPEQIMGKPVAPTTDVYGLGIVIYEMLTGQRPFKGTEVASEDGGPTINERIRFGHLNLAPPNPRSLNPEIPDALARVILKSMAKRPEDRFQSTRELFEACCKATGISPDSLSDFVLLPRESKEIPTTPFKGISPDHPPAEQAQEFVPPPSPQLENRRSASLAMILIPIGSVIVAVVLLYIAYAQFFKPLAAPPASKTPTQLPLPTFTQPFLTSSPSSSLPLQSTTPPSLATNTALPLATTITPAPLTGTITGSVQPVRTATSLAVPAGMPSVCFFNDPNIQNFPQVKVDFRALDAKQHSITGFSGSSLKINENNQPVRNISTSQDLNGSGLNIVFAVDQGNRTDQRMIKSVLQRFGERYMRDGIDRAMIISSMENDKQPGNYVFQAMTDSQKDFLASLDKFIPTEEIFKARSVYLAIKESLNQIRNSRSGCSRPTMIIALSGEDIFAQNLEQSTIDDASRLNVSIHVVHIALGDSYDGDKSFKKLTSVTNGYYLQTKYLPNLDIKTIDQGLYDLIEKERIFYTLEFRSVSGISGEHNVTLSITGQPVPLLGANTRFTISLQDPIVTISNPKEKSVIIRNANLKTNSTFEFDKTSQTVEFSLKWPDGITVDVTDAEVIASNDKFGAETIGKFSSLGTSKVLQWNLGKFIEEGDFSVNLQVQVSDELNRNIKSDPVNVTVKVTIPAELKAATPTQTPIAQSPVNRNTVIFGIGAAFLLLVILTAAIILLIRQGKKTIK